MHSPRCAVAVALGCCLAAVPAVLGTPFATSGGSYTANVAYRLLWNGQQGLQMSTVAGQTIGCASQQGSVGNTVDYGPGAWQCSGFDVGTDSVVTTLTLDRTYTLNKLRTEYQFYRPGTFELRVSTDNSNWTTVVPLQAAAWAQTYSFADTDARYVQWIAYGPGQDGTYVGLRELMAFVSSAASTNIPQREEGYDLAIGAAVVSQSGWQGWGPASAAVDNNMSSDGATPAGPNATAVYNLGAAYLISTLRAGMYASWDYGKLELSPDQVTWYKVYEGALSTGNYNLTAPQTAQYIRLTGTSGAGNGHLRELGAYYMFPEPTGGLLLALGGLLLAVRRR